MVTDVEAAVAFYTSHLGFTLLSKTLPAFADVARGDLRLLLSGPTSSAGRSMPDGRQPAPGGWNRIHLIVEDLAAEVHRLRAAGVHFRNDIVTGPVGQSNRTLPTASTVNAAATPGRGPVRLPDPSFRGRRA
jgi:catechol 2,3-dioxygenase-like lactoylglutathione lyase family enzyme